MSNLTSPRSRWQRGDPMAAYDRLPPDLRMWLAGAALPWSAASVHRLWRRALRETGCPKVAQDRLSAAEARTLAREAAKVWGARYPSQACGKHR
ncbi:hypothetical protein EI545_11625 [Tabrizicola piscis]|uniref:Uncharacterized protein n=1 Tax=Tabrizicola piscis TaxID=2494374 RepID=A0A3S8U7C0_9RHOB|nr:DUF6525 family protein [Tabrizicola piscis]AZL59435.1 hypothetical protein EI545_11625 [Tabrizicola piscis]